MLRWTFSAERHDRENIVALAEAYLDELQRYVAARMPAVPLFTRKLPNILIDLDVVLEIELNAHGGTDNRNRAISHRDHLPKTARLESRRHEERIDARVDPPGHVAVEALDHVARFVSLIGQPPVQYLTNWRMQLASRLLLEGAPVADVAAAVGYESEAAFSRAFKKLVGEAPGTWRRANEAMIQEAFGTAEDAVVVAPYAERLARFTSAQL